MGSVSQDAARVCFAMGMCEQGSPDVYEKHLTMDITRSRVAVLVSQATLAACLTDWSKPDRPSRPIECLRQRADGTIGCRNPEIQFAQCS